MPHFFGMLTVATRFDLVVRCPLEELPLEGLYQIWREKSLNTIMNGKNLP